jgi:ATP-dependent DNA ligase
LLFGIQCREGPLPEHGANRKLASRGEFLEKLLKGNPRLRYVDHIEREGFAMFAGALALGLEGIVAKDAASPYVEGTRVTSYWLKIKDKNYERQEPIESFTRGSSLGLA